MARRARRGRARRVPWTPSIALSLSLGPMPVAPGDSPEPPLDLLAAAWLERRDELLADCRAFERPWAWWAFEDAPDDLCPPRVLEPADDRNPDEYRERHDRARHELDRLRRAWLVAHPEHLNAVERLLLARGNGSVAA